jgi:hypothetical protein
MLRYTLLCDGSSDLALGPIIFHVVQVLLREKGCEEGIRPVWADFGGYRKPPRGLKQRIETAVVSFPCDILFIHRDAEGVGLEFRSAEIDAALEECQLRGSKAVRVVPVRMTEAWLLIDEDAIRRAAGNPRSRVDLELPGLGVIERSPDPKQVLHDALRSASELNTRRRREFRVGPAVQRVAELIQDYSPLRQLPAFRAFETSTRQAIEAWIAERSGAN